MRSTHPSNRRRFMGTIGALCATALPLMAYAQTAPIKLVISWPPGGLADSVGRLLGERMGTLLKRTVIVENKAGAGGQIGTSQFRRSPPNGDTVLLASLNEAMLSAITYKELPYQPLRDLLPVSMVADFPFVLAVPASGPANLADFVVWARQHPKEVTIGCAGLGTPSYFHGLLLGTKVGFDANMIPFAGGAPLMNALAGGQVVAAMNAFGSDMVEMHRSGRTRIIGITGDRRSTHPQFGAVPTFLEAGLPTIPSGWFGLFLPVGAAPATLQMWNQALSEVLATDEVRNRFADFGLVARSSSPQAMSDLMRSDTTVWTDIVKRNNFEPLS